MKNLGSVVIALSLLSTIASAQPAKTPAAPPAKDAKAQVAPPAMPAAPPEVKATVDAFKGNWKFDATLSATGMPGMDKPAKSKMTFNCKVVAGKTAVSCDAKMKTPMGPFEGLFAVAYDPYTKAAHFIGITSMNEVHDHVCTWSGLSLNCKPLKAGMGPGGDEITEEVTMTWEADKKCTANDASCLATAKTVSFKSVSTMTKGGATMTMEGKGKR
jgi:hypothetical protein